MYIAFTLEVPRLFSLIRPCLALLTLGPLGPFLPAARIYTLPRGSARYIYITLNFPPNPQKCPVGGLGPPRSKTTPLSHRIAVLAWDRRQFHTESPFRLGIVESLIRNRRSGLGSATLPHGIAVLACDRRQSRTVSPVWPGTVGSPARNRRSGLGSAALPHGFAVLAWDRGEPRRE